MRRYFFLLIALLLVQSAGAAQDIRGVGLILGSPTGLSAKWWGASLSAWDGALGWDVSGDGFFYVHADYLRHSREMVRKMNLEEVASQNAGVLLFYYGLGGRVEVGDDSRAGVRLPVGLEYLMADVPLGWFIEIVPLMDLLPQTKFRLKGGIGLRYLF